MAQGQRLAETKKGRRVERHKEPIVMPLPERPHLAVSEDLALTLGNTLWQQATLTRGLGRFGCMSLNSPDFVHFPVHKL